jgi:hypothetical protein
MIQRWESDLYEDPRDAVAAASEAAALLEEEGYKVGEIFWDYYIVYDEEGAGTVAGKQSHFFYGLPDDKLPGEKAETFMKGMVILIAGGSALFIGTVVVLGVMGSKRLG